MRHRSFLLDRKSSPPVLEHRTGVFCLTAVSQGPGLKLWVRAETSPCSVLLQLFATAHLSMFASSPKVLFPSWTLDGGGRAHRVRSWWGGNDWWCSSLCWSALAFRASTASSERLLSLGAFLATIHERDFAGRLRILAWEKSPSILKDPHWWLLFSV